MNKSKYGVKGCLFSVLALAVIGVSAGLGLLVLRPLIAETLAKRLCPSKEMPNGRIRRRPFGRSNAIECYDAPTYKAVDISYVDIFAVCPTFILFFGGMSFLSVLAIITRTRPRDSLPPHTKAG